MTQTPPRSTALSTYYWLGIVFMAISIVLVLLTAMGLVLSLVRHTNPAYLVLVFFPAAAFALAGILFIVTASRRPTARQDATGTSGFAAHGLSFDVGVVERHRVDFAWDQMWGNVTITVDGVPLQNDLQMFSVSLVKSWDFPVGVTEVHQVRIEKHRALFFSFARPQLILAFVDGQFVARKD
jgi:hypothetical protein